MYKRGLVIGKFYPPHRGHKYLIDTAVSKCETVTVIVCWKKNEVIPGPLRADWIRKIHPGVEVKVVVDDHLSDDDSKGWAEETIKVLGYVPDAVFTSEAYGDPYASYMGCVHVLVDKERATVPISGTMVRSDPQRHGAFLEPIVRAYFAKRVCVLGAESTGTTTLARALAEHYKTVWVPEYGRFYSEGKLYGGEEAAWRSEEFTAIAEAQCALEDSLAEASTGLVICDTDAFATSLWHERYMGTRSPAVEEIAAKRQYDLYLLTGDEIPFEQDGTRDGEHIRHDMHARFIERLTEEGKPYLLVTGSREERLAAAVAAIDKLRAG
ncbi:MAG TPA: AAA family ATPase [Candidatus Paceibacterota bacterium]|nr:AAA family ATPase [Candidatus Paceibacterota bacterium]